MRALRRPSPSRASHQNRRYRRIGMLDPAARSRRADDGGILRRRIGMRAGLGIRDENFREPIIGISRNRCEIAQAVTFEGEGFARPGVCQALAGGGHGATLGPPWKAPPCSESAASEASFSNK